MSHVEQAPALPLPDPALTKPVLGRWLALSLLALLLVFIGSQMNTLWSEFAGLQEELTHARQTTVVGYVQINPNPNYAACPENWLHDEGSNTLLWAGWTPGVGHGWFRVGRGEIVREHVSAPLGRDVIQAIDWPVVEVGGGTRWQRIPWDAPVAGMVLDGVPCVYPVVVLRSVEVINDEVNTKPILVTYSPFAPRDKAIRVYDPMVDGHRVTMGLSGYLHDRKPLLYDRGTESLWVEDGEELAAIAGRLKGARLSEIGQPLQVSWNDWQSKYPQSRLLVGADRSRPKPRQ